MVDDLPELPAPTQRKLALHWDELKEQIGLTGEHLDWPRTRPRKLLVLPPPPTIAGSPGRVSTFSRGATNPPGSFREATGPVYESEARVGMAETINLAELRFPHLATEYFALWSADEDGRTEAFAEWLEGIRARVIADVAQLWTKRGSWFERHCRATVHARLAPLVKEWASKARTLEIRRLENKHPAFSIEQASSEYALGIQEDGEALERSRVTHDRSQTTRSESEEAARQTAGVEFSADAVERRIDESDRELSRPGEGWNASPKPGEMAPAAAANADSNSGQNRRIVHWQDIEISFLDSELVEVKRCGTRENLNYRAMGFADRRGGKKGDRGPNKAWALLRLFAARDGEVNLDRYMPKRKEKKGPPDEDPDPDPAGTSYEEIEARCSGAAKARTVLQTRVKELRSGLCSYFGIKESPIVYDDRTYRVQFKLGCARSYHS